MWAEIRDKKCPQQVSNPGPQDSLTAWVFGLWFYGNIGKGIESTVDGKVKWLETSDNKLCKVR